MVAVLGTTISPYLFFWQAEQEVEAEHEDSAARPLRQAPEQGLEELQRIRLDTYVGMAVSNLVALFIVITTAATLHAHGITDIETSSQAAEALRPFAGRFAFTVFSVGIVGTGLLAVPVLAGSAAYALAEVRQWPAGLARLPRQARAFYAATALPTCLGGLVNLTPIDPVRALFWSTVINGVVAVPVMASMVLLSRRTVVMGQFTLVHGLAAMGWLATLVMAAAAAAAGMFATFGREADAPSAWLRSFPDLAPNTSVLASPIPRRRAHEPGWTVSSAAEVDGRVHRPARQAAAGPYRHRQR